MRGKKRDIRPRPASSFRRWVLNKRPDKIQRIIHERICAVNECLQTHFSTLKPLLKQVIVKLIKDSFGIKEDDRVNTEVDSYIEEEGFNWLRNMALGLLARTFSAKKGMPRVTMDFVEPREIHLLDLDSKLVIPVLQQILSELFPRILEFFSQAQNMDWKPDEAIKLLEVLTDGVISELKYERFRSIRHFLIVFEVLIELAHRGSTSDIKRKATQLLRRIYKEGILPDLRGQRVRAKYESLLREYEEELVFWKKITPDILEAIKEAQIEILEYPYAVLGPKVAIRRWQDRSSGELFEDGDIPAEAPIEESLDRKLFNTKGRERILSYLRKRYPTLTMREFNRCLRRRPHENALFFVARRYRYTPTGLSALLIEARRVRKINRAWQDYLTSMQPPS